MENNDKIEMSKFAFERMQAKDEANDRWRNIIIITMIVWNIISTASFVVSNLLWLKAWNEYDYEMTDDYSVEVDSGEGGNANYIGNDGNIYNGESNGTENENTEKNS